MKSGGSRGGRGSSPPSLSPPAISTAATAGPCDGINVTGVIMLGDEGASFLTFFFRIEENRNPTRCIFSCKV